VANNGDRPSSGSRVRQERGGSRLRLEQVVPRPPARVDIGALPSETVTARGDVARPRRSRVEMQEARTTMRPALRAPRRALSTRCECVKVAPK